MEDPGPNVLEQIVKSNELLAAILAAGPGAVGPTVLSGGAAPAQWPIIFYLANPTLVPFLLTTHASGGSVAVTTTDREALSPRSAIKLQTAAGGGTGHWASLSLNIPTTPALALRLQIAFATAMNTNALDYEFAFKFDVPPNRYTARIFLNRTSEEAAYLNSAGVETSLANNTWYTFDWAWNKLDLVINLADLKYHWLAVNHHPFDLSAQSMRTANATTFSLMSFHIIIHNNSADQTGVALIDEILITDELYTGPT